jgi:hypothetical protein
VVFGADPQPDVRAAALVAAARTRDQAERQPPRLPERQRLGKREGWDGRQFQRPSRRGDVHTRAIGVHGDVGHFDGVDVARREYAVDLTLTWRRGAGESGIAGQREFHCR